MKQSPEQLKETRRTWRKNNPEKEKEYRKRHYEKYKDYCLVLGREGYRERKVEVLTHYGNGVCACVKCGFDDIRALSIDHIDGGGLEHRRSLGITSGGNFYLWLKRNVFPTGYQTLCMNCQYIKRSENKEI